MLFNLRSCLIKKSLMFRYIEYILLISYMKMIMQTLDIGKYSGSRFVSGNNKPIVFNLKKKETFLMKLGGILLNPDNTLALKDVFFRFFLTLYLYIRFKVVFKMPSTHMATLLLYLYINYNYIFFIYFAIIKK